MTTLIEELRLACYNDYAEFDGEGVLKKTPPPIHDLRWRAAADIERLEDFMYKILRKATYDSPDVTWKEIRHLALEALRGGREYESKNRHR